MIKMRRDRNQSLVADHHLLRFLSFALLLLPFALTAQFPKFTDVTLEAGIDHFFDTFEGTFGGGAAILDFDKDGWEDVFIAGGDGPNQLLKNLGDGTFEDVSIPAGISAISNLVTQGAAVADVNKDGWPDLFITTIATIDGINFEEAPNVLMLNNGKGFFSDRTAEYNLIEPTFSTSASFGDVNGDGYPDLYVSNYFEDFEGRLDEFGGPLPGGDTGPGKDLFYVNIGGGSFIEVSETYGINRPGLTFQALWSDIDNDHDLDILVANDFGHLRTPNLLYRNDFPLNKFSEIGAERNFDFGINGMGIGSADINSDGLLDYIVTNILISPFFISQGADAPFLEESVVRGTGFTGVSTDEGIRVTQVSWGVNFFDFDNDMDSDLYITNGSLNPQLAPNPNLFLENEGGQFSDIGFITSINDHSIGRGSVVFDYDKDGDVDILVVNQHPYRDEDVGVDFIGSRLFRNDNNNGNNWLKVKLAGSRSETFGIGSRLELHVDETMIIREVYGGSSHESQNSTIMHFGLGSATNVDSIVVHWIGGERQTVTGITVNQELTIEEKIAEIPELDENLLTASPSPFTENVIVKYTLANNDVEMVRLDVLDVAGRLVYEFPISAIQTISGGGVWSVPETFTTGIYLIRLVASNGITTVPVVKI